MGWAALGIAITAVGIAIRMYFLGRDLEKTRADRDKERKRADLFADQFEQLKKRSEARVHELKEKYSRLSKEFMQTGGDGARRAFLNGLLEDEDSEDPGGDSDVRDGGSTDETG